MQTQLLNSVAIPIRWFHTSLAIFVSTLYWSLQVFGSSLSLDMFHFSIILIAGMLWLTDRKNRAILSIVCGYLVGSLQGITLKSGVADGQIITSTMTALTLAFLSVGFRGRFSKKGLLFLALSVLIPVFFGIFSFYFSDYQFIPSEAKKFLLFSVFLVMTVSCASKENIFLWRLLAHTVCAVSLLAILNFLLFQIGYSYGGLVYPIIPVSVTVLPLMYLFTRDSLYLAYTLAMILLIAFGLLQPSAKIMLLIVILSVVALRKFTFYGIVASGVALIVLVYGSLVFDDMLRHKWFSIFSALEAAKNLAFSGSVDDVEILFRTSAGNLIAEFLSVIKLLMDSFFVPYGIGFSISDTLGWLSMANEAAYAPASTENAIYPLHLGVYYLLLWYGPLVLLFLYFREYYFFMTVFIIFSLSAPTLIFLSSILCYNFTHNYREIDK